MKKIKSLRIASILLIGTLLTTCLLGGTFAKYTTSTSGSSSAEVAKWSFRVNKQEIASQQQSTYTFQLFNTVNEADGTTTEDNVLNGKIAPGTGGSFKMTVQNMSEVSAKYSINLEETNTSNIPIQYSLDGENWVSSLSTLAEDNLKDLDIVANSSVIDHTLYWRWVFDENALGAPSSQNDASDSELGYYVKSAVPSVMVTATITASQVD